MSNLRTAWHPTVCWLSAVWVIVWGATSVVPAAEPHGSPSVPFVRFRHHVLNAESRFSSAAVADFDRDGKPEIVSGAFRYRGPRWQPELIRDVEEIRGRFDDYSNLPLDVDRDGWLDLVSVNYRSQSLYWVRNPGRGDGLWPRQVIDRPGASETGRLVDIDGDGSVDILPNGADFAAWYQLRRDEATESTDLERTVKWIRHDLPPQLAGHGLGAGDVDGDGDTDIVGPRGWARQDRHEDEIRWTWREEFRLHRDASMPILVWDVDGDADADLVWGRGHNVGLYWLEQRQVDGRRAWVWQVIDTTISQVHAPLAGDLDGDGRAELIAGRRYLGHDGRDPGETDPLRIVIYGWRDASRTWQSQELTRGGPWGMDLDPKCDDVDGDGDLDLVASARTGLCWFENLRLTPASTIPAEGTREDASDELKRLPSGYRHDRLLEWIESSESGESVHDVTGPLDWGRRRWHIRLGMERVMGELPTSADRVPLEVRVDEILETPRWERRRISYQADRTHRVPAYLYLPRGAAADGRAMLCLHPTSPLGKDIISGQGNDPGRSYAVELAERGYVVLAPDYPSFGEYVVEFGSADDTYVSGSMRAIWDNHRAVDLLESLSEVDPNRIGCLGHSLGGHNSLFTAALDQRLRAVVTSCGFTAFADYYGGNLKGWTSDRYMPRIRDEFGGQPERMPFDFPEVLGMIAPRPLFVSAPRGDSNFDVRGVEKCIEAVRPVYELYGQPGAIQVRYPDAAHSFPDAVRAEVYAWLDRVL